MDPPRNSLDADHLQLPAIKIHHPSSPRHLHQHSGGYSPTLTSGSRRKIGIAVDLSNESAYAVRWAVSHYIRPGDAAVLLHVSPTSVLFGADWGPLPLPTGPPTSPHTETHRSSVDNDGKKHSQTEDFDAFTASKASDLAKLLREAMIPYKIHIVKDHDMKERLCLEVERLGLSAIIMGSRGFGAARRGNDGRLGSVSDYCVHHCVCPVVVVRYPDDKDGDGDNERDAVINVPVEDENEEARGAVNQCREKKT